MGDVLQASSYTVNPSDEIASQKSDSVHGLLVAEDPKHLLH